MLMELTQLKKIYLIVILLLGPLIIFLVNFLINRTKLLRQSKIHDQDPFQPIQTGTPFDKPRQILRRAALRGIESRFSIIRNLILIALTILWGIAVAFPFLNKMPATIVSLLAASAAVITGIAAKPFIENIISGIVITFSKPFRTGDTLVIDTQYGTVEDITLTHTVLKIWNWRRYVIPNSQMLNKEFVNCTINDSYQCVHVEFWVSHDIDMDRIQTMAIAAAKKSDFFAAYEEPRFWIMEMGKDSVRCWIAAWADSPTDAWELGNDIRTGLLRAFRKGRIKAHQFIIKSGR